MDISRSKYNELIYKWIIGKNSEWNRKIMKRRLIDGITFERLAEEFNLSNRHVKNIVYKGMKIIIKHI